MAGSAVVYSGLVLLLAGLLLTAKPIARLGIGTRSRALGTACAGLAVATIGLLAPAFDSRTTIARTRLDELAPAWQFHEVHRIRIAAPPERVFDAVRRVRADEIFLFHTLTWIRRGGREAPQSILNAGTRESLIDVATHSGFVRLADEAPRELVVGTVVVAPPGSRRETLTPRVFQAPLPPGFALATMNFLVTPDGPNGSTLTTETRVFANDPSARRRFARYWRIIYPGSAIIRRMWLRAIARRALGAGPAASGP
jgi:hypothetical protein